MEGELVHKLDMRSELVDALIASSPLANPSEKSLRRRRENLLQLTDRDLKRRLEKKKSEYSGFLGDIIARNPGQSPPRGALPQGRAARLRAHEDLVREAGGEGRDVGRMTHDEKRPG